MTKIIRITVGDGFKPTPLRFEDTREAWDFISELYHATCKAQNPENMPIKIEFGEEEVKTDDFV